MSTSEPLPHFTYVTDDGAPLMHQERDGSLDDRLGQIDFAILSGSAEIIGYSQRTEGETTAFAGFMRRCLPLVIQCCTDTLNAIAQNPTPEEEGGPS